MPLSGRLYGDRFRWGRLCSTYPSLATLHGGLQLSA